MVQCRLFKLLWHSGRTLYLQCDVDLPVVPQPGSLIYVGGPAAWEYDQDTVSEEEGSVFLRANEPRVYAWVQPFVCDENDGSEEVPNSIEQWLKHFEAYGWRQCPEPKPWSVKFQSAPQPSLAH